MVDRRAKFKLAVRCFVWLVVANGCTITSPPPAPVAVSDSPQGGPPAEQTALVEHTEHPEHVAKILAPAAGTLTVAIISDMNSGYGSTEYITSLRSTIDWLCNKARPDLVLGTGDMVAGMKAGLDYPAMWAALHQNVTDKLKACGLTFVPTPGNHDGAAGGGFSREREEYVRQWTARKPDFPFVSDERWPLDFSFDYGPPGARVRFVGLDLTIPNPMSPDDLSWLDAQLDTRLPIIAFGHVPIIPTARDREREASYDTALQNLLVSHGAWFIHGHHHAYFAHQNGGLPTISMPNLGTGPRAWLGSNTIGGHGTILLTVQNGNISWQAYHAPSFEPWNLTELPDRISWSGRSVERWNP